MLICPNCGHRNPADRIRCEECLARLTATSANQTESEMVITKPHWAPAGGLVVAFGLLLFSVGLTGSLLDEGQRAAWLGVMGIGLVAVVFGVYMAGLATTIAFNEPPGYVTVAQRHMVLFLKFVTTKRISRQEARTAFVAPVEHTEYYPARTVTVYQVRAVTETGKEVTLYEDRERGVAKYFAERISQFGAGKDLPAPSR